jgi:hypothetical protein
MASDPTEMANAAAPSPADSRPWYREPETFIAVAALVVSISAVAVGLYEADLQRRHDRAEVWPHLQLEVFTSPTGAEIVLENTGIGPAIVNSADVTLDGKPGSNWKEVVSEWAGRDVALSANTAVVGNALRPGDRTTLVAVPQSSLPPHFWESVARIGVNL